MNAENAQLLAQLKDIHSAGAPGWWPPAPGWWALAAIGLVLLMFALRFAAAQLVRIRRRRGWLRALEAVAAEYDPADDPHEYLAAVNRLFRAVALKAFPVESCARLEGEDWVNFIRGALPGSSGAADLDALARGPYQRLPEFDAARLRQHARQWVKLYG